MNHFSDCLSSCYVCQVRSNAGSLFIYFLVVTAFIESHVLDFGLIPVCAAERSIFAGWPLCCHAFGQTQTHMPNVLLHILPINRHVSFLRDNKYDNKMVFIATTPAIQQLPTRILPLPFDARRSKVVLYYFLKAQ